MARSNKTAFNEIVRSERDKAIAKRLKSQTEKLAKADKRIAELDAIINRLFEKTSAPTFPQVGEGFSFCPKFRAL